MARVNICGFETGDLSECSAISGGVSVVSTTKRSGTYSLKCVATAGVSAVVEISALNANGTMVGEAGSVAALYVRAYYNLSVLPASTIPILQIFDTALANLPLQLKLTSTGTLQLINKAGAQVGSDSSALSTGTWYRIEVRCIPGASNVTGTLEAKIDGTAFATTTTGDAGTVNLAQFVRFGQNALVASTLFIDDVAIDDAAYPGAGQVNILKPNATGTTSQWTNGAGTSPTNVAEVPHDSDTGYIKTSTSGNVTTVNLDSSATGGVSGTITCTKTIGIIRDAGGVSSMLIRTKSGATNSDTTAGDPGATYVPRSQILTTDPATSAAWTTTALDALEIGVVNSASFTVRCTALYAMVECDGVVASTGFKNLPLLGVG